MISVVIATLNTGRLLTDTLSALIPAAVDGLVRQVVIADGGSTDATLEIAEDAGALIVAGPLMAGVAAAPELWVLVLAPGARLVPGWEPMAYAHTQTTGGKAGWIGPVRPKGLVGWALALGGEPVVGLLAPKTLLTGQPETVNELARALGRGRLVRLGFSATYEV